MKLRTRSPAKRKRAASDQLSPESTMNKRIRAGALLSLPNEIVDQIASHLIETRDIASMVQVSKTFVASMNKALYSSSSHIEPFINSNNLRLLKFTRTILGSPELADMVTSITLGSTTKTEEPSTGRPKHAKELNKLLGKDANLFHKAAREVSIRSNFRHHDPAARKDDLWAVLISQLCNLRSLALHIEVEMNDHRFEARTQSMDQLMEWAVGGRKLRHFQHLELMSMFAVVPFTALCRPIAAPLRVPKFIGSHASFLRIPTMKLYATDFFVPQNMPTSSISCLDMSESYHHTYYGGLGDLSPYFLLSRSELRQLCWASSNLDYLNSCHVPGSLKHLKIHHTGELRSYAYQARGLDYPGSSIGRKNFSQLEILEIHYKTLEDEFVRDRSFDAPQELLVFGYEKWSDSDQYGLTYQQLQKMVTC